MPRYLFSAASISFPCEGLEGKTNWQVGCHGAATAAFRAKCKHQSRVLPSLTGTQPESAALFFTFAGRTSLKYGEAV